MTRGQPKTDADFLNFIKKQKEEKMSKIDPFDTPNSVPALDQEVIGMEKFAAIVKIEDAGCNARIVSEDGEPFVVTMDYRSDRLNLDIIQGKVVSVHRG